MRRDISIFRRKLSAPFFIAIASLCVLGMSWTPLDRAAATQRPSAGPLQCTIASGFTVAAVGDLIIARPESTDTNPEFQAQMRILRDADVAFGNFEGTAIDIRHFGGSPQAESGGAWLVAAPSVPADLKKMGFSMMNRANNHDTDWGVKGMMETDHLLDEAGIVHAGTGKDLAAARAPQYLETPKGRVALVGITATFPSMSVAADPEGVVPGRAGVDALRTTEWVLVTRSVMQTLVQLHNDLPDQAKKQIAGIPQKLTLLRTHYRLSDHVGYDYSMNHADLNAFIRNVREGKESSDFLIATIHCHQPGNWSRIPPDFLVTLAHDAIDNGADAFIAQGPHQLRGIEIYKGKPIFYSLGNYFFEEYQQQVITPMLYKRFHENPDTGIPAEFENARTSRFFGGGQFWTSVIAASNYQHGHLSEIRLYPIDLGVGRRWNQRGVPRLASSAVAHLILRRLAGESKPFGTTVEIDRNVGIIRVSPAR